MFDSPPDFFSLIIAIAALIFARKAYVDAKRLRARLDAMGAAAAPVATPAPLPLPQHDPAPAPQPDLPAEPPAIPAEIAPAMSASGDSTAAPPPTTPPPPSQADPGFEERIGTRWVVWIGGRGLAPGGVFPGRFSFAGRGVG